MRTLIRLLLCLAVCGALATAAAGCGSSEALDPVAQAAQATKNAGGSHLELKMSMAIAGNNLAVTGTGFFNYRAKEGSLTMSMTGLPQLPGGGLKMDERLKGTTVYVGTDLFAGKLPNGARWAKVDLGRALSSAFGVNPQSLWGGGSNPAQILDYLKASAGGVTNLGSDQVRGVATTRYRGTLDLLKAADQAPASARAQTRDAIKKLIEETGARYLPAEVWIDAQHRVRRMKMSFSVSVAGQSSTIALEEELFDYGPTPAVVAPPASETYDLTQQALKGLGALNGG